MDTSHWSQPQGNNNITGVVKPIILEEGSNSRSLVERRARPQKDQALNCPRCNSTNTKFCYYNNYSLSQPRFICKTCKRYWTEGGSLRNVPVGGGSRKNKRSSTSSNSSSSPSNSSKKIVHHHHDLNPSLTTFPQSASQNPKIQQGQDLNLAYPPSTEDSNNNNNYESLSRLIEVPNYQNTLGSTSSHVSAMDFLKSAGIGSRGLMSSFMPMGSMVQDSNAIFSSGFIPNLQEFKPNLNFGLDGFESGYGVADNCSNARLLFPTTEDLKQQVSGTSTTTEFVNDQQNRGLGGNFAGYWNGMLGGGSW